MVKELTGLIPGIAQGIGTDKSQKASKGEGSFGDMLAKSLQKVDALQKDADAAVQKIAEGESVGVQETMVAIEKADVTFKLMMEVRQKILEAYQEIIRMQV